jgi:hypothetical protein
MNTEDKGTQIEPEELEGPKFFLDEEIEDKNTIYQNVSFIIEDHINNEDY